MSMARDDRLTRRCDYRTVDPVRKSRHMSLEYVHPTCAPIRGKGGTLSVEISTENYEQYIGWGQKHPQQDSRGDSTWKDLQFGQRHTASEVSVSISNLG